MSSPNPLRVLWSILGARRLAPPRPTGSADVDHSALDPILSAVAATGIDALEPLGDDLSAYVRSLSTIDPDRLGRDGALAYWINLYNAQALDLARRAVIEGRASVLDIGRGFQQATVTVGGEQLSLEGIEHGKIRRFRDPRIHAALVCGSVSCPTLRFESYRGSNLDAQLDDQMRHFLASGAFVADRAARAAYLSRVFLWYGADFVRPQRMPTLLPAPKRRIASALSRWLDPDDAAWLESDRPNIRFQEYDWGLGCAVRSPS